MNEQAFAFSPIARICLMLTTHETSVPPGMLVYTQGLIGAIQVDHQELLLQCDPRFVPNFLKEFIRLPAGVDLPSLRRIVIGIIGYLDLGDLIQMVITCT